MILAGLVLSGRCTYHGEGGEGLRDEAGDRGGEHRLLGHGSLGDGGLGDCGGGEMRGAGKIVRSTSRRATRAGTNFSNSVDRAAGSIVGRGTGTHRWPCGQPCGPRALRGTREGHGGSRSAGKSRRQIERGGVRQQSPLMAKIDAREGRSQSQTRACSGPIAAVLTGGDRALHGEGHAGHFVCG